MALPQTGIEAVLKDDQFQQALKRCMTGYDQFDSKGKQVASSQSGVWSKLSSHFVITAGDIVGAITNIYAKLAQPIQMGLNFNAMKEQAEVAFGVILGSTDKATKLIGELQQFAATTPFEFPELQAATKSLLSFGVTSEEIVPTLTKIGDIASGLNIPVGDLAQIYGKMRVQGRLFADDMNQLQGRGIPLTKELAKMFKVDESAIRGMVEKGKIGFKEVDAVMTNLTKKGGMFSGMMDKQSKTFNGMMSTLKDNLTQLAGKLTKPLFEVATKAIEGFNNILGSESFQAGIQSVSDLFEGLVDVFILGKEPLGDWSLWWEKLSKLFGGDLAGQITDIVMAVQNQDWGKIATIVWSWVGIAVNQLATQVGYVVNGIANYLRDHWDTDIKPILMVWAGKFWDWVNVVIGSLGLKLGAWITAFGTWAGSKETQDWLFGFGGQLGYGLVEGIISFLTTAGQQTGNGSIAQTIVNMLQTAVSGIMVVIREIGAGIGVGILNGITGGLLDDSRVGWFKEWLRNYFRYMFSTALGPFGGALGQLGGFRQTGGPVWRGMPYTVGEAGRELFVPKTDGWILPHSMTPSPSYALAPSAGARTINIHLHSPVYGVSDLQRTIGRAITHSERH